MNLLDVTLVPIPNELVASIVKLRDDLISGEIDVATVLGDAPPAPWYEVPDQGRWTEPMLVRLHQRLSYPLVRELLDTCAGRPGQWVTKAEIDEVGGVGPYQLRNELSAFTKLTRKLFGDAGWPIEFVKAEDGYRYRMPDQLAAIWRQVDGSLGGVGSDSQ